MDNQKECPVCGKTYDSSHNFCSKHDDAIKLVYSRDLVKTCPKCGRKFTTDDNFCPQHDDLIELVNVDDLVKECRACGAKYPEDYNFCIRCNFDEPLVYIFTPPKIKDIKTSPNKYFTFRQYSNAFNDFSDFIFQINAARWTDFDFSKSQFDEIINNIILTYQMILKGLIDEYRIDFNALQPLEKMLLFSKSFVKTEYKEGGGDLGHYEFNEIHIDDRASDALQITTIIHELSHFLLAEILEQITSEILDAEKTEVIEAFVSYILVNDKLNYLIDEYCAHTVEGRFAPWGYQDYGSYERALSGFLQDYSEEHIDVANSIGNTFAHYIKFIMESFIDDSLREDIKAEFTKISDVPNSSGLKYETREVFDWQRFLQSIRIMLTSSIDDINQNPHKLELYVVEFRKNNQE